MIVSPYQFGDALTAFPTAAALKARYPGSEVWFCAPEYTRPLVEACGHVDGFLSLESALDDPDALAACRIDVLVNLLSDGPVAAAAQRAGIPVRVSNLRRLAGARNSNRFVAFSRSNSADHVVMLNLRTLSVLGVDPRIPEAAWPPLFGLTGLRPLPERVRAFLRPGHFHLVIHPKSGGHGREWPVQRYAELAERLSAHPVQVLVTGVRREREAILREQPDFFEATGATDLTGQLSAPEFFSLLQAIDGIVASGTGPLHIAAALGRHALGIFPPRRNMNPAKWRPIGPKAEYLMGNTGCTARRPACRNSEDGPACACTLQITTDLVLGRVLHWVQLHSGGATATAAGSTARMAGPVPAAVAAGA